MKRLGYAVDAVFLALSLYAASEHPAFSTLKADGLRGVQLQVSAQLADLRSANATDAAVVWGQWWDYFFGANLGGANNADPALRQFFEWNEWKNSLLLPTAVRQSLPHGLAVWLRNMLAGWLLFYITGAAWAVWIYLLRGNYYFPNPEDKPSWEDVYLQMKVSTQSMVLYSLMPTWSEWLMERGWTYTYYNIADVGGWGAATAWLVVYLLFVEWGIYWIHRGLHESKYLYNLLHRPHHIYNNRNSLSPFAGLAFHPVDGMLQATPYLLGLFLMPIQFWMHEAILFFTGVWTANIHDTLTGNTEPIMGSAYHTIHHTTYKNNYGQIFVLFDWLHDTLAPPKHMREKWGWDTPTGRSRAHNLKEQ